MGSGPAGSLPALTLDARRLGRLRTAAEAARRLHHAPYSGHLVLAAAELASGTVAGGSNVEIVNFSLTKHAEELAILLAFAADADRVASARLSAVYVAGSQPCGSCRQFAAEFAQDGAVWVIEQVEQPELRSRSLLDIPDHGYTVVPFDEYLPYPFLPGASGPR